jgi:hypothetical protein
MRPDRRLLALLEKHGVKGPTAAPAAAWSAFKEFGREHFGKEGVGLLFQVGDFELDERRFHFDPVCQFEIVDDQGEHDHFEQTHCEMTSEVTKELEGIERELWSFDFPTADAFFEAVEALPEFRLAITPKQYKINVRHEEV